VEKPIANSYISAYFDVWLLEKQEFIGQIDQIIKLNSDSVKPIFIQAKWYKNDMSPRHASTILVQDKCGIQRVLAKAFLKDDQVKHKPFVFPEHCNQVFLVPDRLHPHWQLVVDTEVHRTRPTIPRPPQEVTASGAGTSQSQEEDGNEGPTVESDSEGESDMGKMPSTNEEGIYLEEIITYKRRLYHPLVVENHILKGSVVDDVLSNKENAPNMGDFPTIET
jgi:hypothetical protein